MNKQDLIKALAEKLEVSQKDAKETYETFVSLVTDEIMKEENEKISLPGLVTFKKSHKEARTASNPRTGEPVHVDAHTRLSATPVQSLKDSVR